MLRTNFTLFRKKIKNEDIYIKTLTIIDVYSRLHCEVLQLQRMLSDWLGIIQALMAGEVVGAY